MNVETMTFGIEIETTIPSGALGIAVGPHGCGNSIPGLTGWKADHDPSIRVADVAHQACEFVSPVFTGTAGLVKLLADVEWIKGIGAKVNDSCGLHIHVGFDKSDTEKLDRLISLVSNFEKAIYAATGTKRREVGRWCASLQRYGDRDTAKAHGRNNRYHVLNIATGLKPTVEFRAFGASLKALKIATYVRMCLAVVERACTAKRSAEWIGKVPVETSPVHRNGEGQTAITRLCYQIGWTKGRTDYTYGNLVADGLPSIKDCKKELVRLAKKYDSAAEAANEEATAPFGLPMNPAPRAGTRAAASALGIVRPRARRQSRIRVGQTVRVSPTIQASTLTIPPAAPGSIGVVVSRRRAGWTVRFGTVGVTELTYAVISARHLQVISEF